MSCSGNVTVKEKECITCDLADETLKICDNRDETINKLFQKELLLSSASKTSYSSADSVDYKGQ